MSLLRDLSKLPRNVLEERFIELEQMLTDFQESSKDLEKALEDELTIQEETNEKLIQTIKLKDYDIKKEKVKNLNLNNELNKVQNDVISQKKHYEEQINNLKSSLVSIEISNDYMESNDRVLQSKLEYSNQFNNELLEKLAIIENDLELEKNKNIENQLLKTNYENKIKDLKNQKAFLESRLSNYIDIDSDDSDDFDSTVLSMKEVLSNGPPIYIVPRTVSLQKCHDLTNNFNILNEKLQNWNLSLYGDKLKSNPTTQITTNDDINHSKKLSKISPSPSMLNLSINDYDDDDDTTNSPTKYKSSNSISSFSTSPISSSSSSSLNHSFKKSLSYPHSQTNHSAHYKRKSIKGPVNLDTIEGSPNNVKIKDSKINSNGKKGLFSPLKSLV